MTDIVFEIKNLDYSDDSASYSMISINAEHGAAITCAANQQQQRIALLQTISGIKPFQQGSIRLGDFYLERADEIGKRRFRNRFCGIFLDNAPMIEKLSVYDNLMLPTLPLAWQTVDESWANDLLVWMSLESIQREIVKNVDISTKMRLAIARTLINKPAVVLAEISDTASKNISKQLFQSWISLCKKHGVILIYFAKNVIDCTAAFDLEH